MPSFDLSLQPHDHECALRSRGIQGSRVTGAGRYQQKKGGRGKKQGWREKVERGGKRERAGDLVLTSPFFSLCARQKKQQPAGAGAAGRSRPRAGKKKIFAQFRNSPKQPVDDRPPWTWIFGSVSPPWDSSLCFPLTFHSTFFSLHNFPLRRQPRCRTVSSKRKSKTRHGHSALSRQPRLLGVWR